MMRSWPTSLWLPLACVVAAPFAFPTPAYAQRALLEVSARTLGDALRQLSDRARINILYDPRLVAGRPAKRVRADTLAGALTQLLEGTGLIWRRLPTGSYAIVASAPAPEQRLETPEPAPDIIVVGSRSLDADIRREVNDVQPYRVASADEIDQSQASDPESYARRRLSSNAADLAFSQTPIKAFASVRSQIDLRGLGTDQTLVLVDGRRMPSVPSTDEFLQPDVNGIPVAAIERIETLSSTAGGIYGPGATGGMVNIVLKRDYQGMEVRATTGISARGDSPYHRFDGHIGWTSPGGGTRVTLIASHSEDEGLSLGQRDFAEEARKLRYNAALPSSPPVSPGTNILSGSGAPLQLQPALGGQILTGATTYLPPSVAAASLAGLAALQANTGRYDLMLASGDSGSNLSMLPLVKTDSAIFGLRQTITPSIEAFIDLLYLSDRGTARGPGLVNDLSVPVGAYGNPFQQTVQIAFPTGTLSGIATTRTITERATAGLIVRLPANWKLEIDGTFGRTIVHQYSLSYGLPPLTLNLFSGLATIESYYAGMTPSADTQSRAVNDLRDVTVRAGGSLFRLPGGVATLTLSGEVREENNPGETSTSALQGEPGTTSQLQAQRQTVYSGYSELRAPLGSETSKLPFLRGLELQLAARYDDFRVSVPVANDVLNQTSRAPGTTQIRDEQDTLAFTAGLKSQPFSWLMLRGSYATGYLPPTSTQIIPVMLQLPVGLLNDPERGGSQFGQAGTFTVYLLGSPKLRPERAQSFNVGLVLTPLGTDGPRLAVSYSRIDKSNEIVNLANGDLTYFLKRGSQYPDRVIRAPVTAADTARGYTVGVITAIDNSAINIGRSHIQAVDVDLDYRLRTAALGVFRLTAMSSWEPDFRRRVDPQQAYLQYANTLDGPLDWRANASLAWSLNRASASFSGEYFGRYRVLEPGAPGATEVLEVQQGTSTIPAQFYLDATLGYRFSTGGRDLQIQFGIQNIARRSG